MTKQPIFQSEKEKAFENSKGKLLKMIRTFVKKNEKNEQEQLERFLILEDWKILAARIDKIMFFVTFFIVFIVPVYLFGKYGLISDSKLSQKCSCPKI